MATVTTTETNTERTAEDIMNSLRDGTYTTKNGKLLVTYEYGELVISHNPLRNNYHRDGLIALNDKTIAELINLKELMKARDEKREAEWSIKETTDLLNKENK